MTSGAPTQLVGVRRSARRVGWEAFPAMVFVLVFAALPLVVMIVWSFWEPEEYWIKPSFTLEAYRKFVTTGRHIVFLKSLRIAAVVTGISVLLGFPAAYFLQKLAPPRPRTLLLALFVVPFFTSYIVRTFAWRLILGRLGLVNNLLIDLGLIREPLEWLLFNEFSIHVGLLAAYLPFMIFPIVLSLGRVELSVLEASQDLGATSGKTLRYIILPLAAPGIFAGCIFTFVMALGSTVEVSFLGGGEAMVATMLTSLLEALQFPMAFAVAAILLGLMAAVLLIANRFFKLGKLFESAYR